MTGAMGAERNAAQVEEGLGGGLVCGPPSTALTGDGTLQAFQFRSGEATIQQLQALEIDGSGGSSPPFPRLTTLLTRCKRLSTHPLETKL